MTPSTGSTTFASLHSAEAAQANSTVWPLAAERLTVKVAVPADVAVDARGEPTTDAKALIANAKDASEQLKAGQGLLGALFFGAGARFELGFDAAELVLGQLRALGYTPTERMAAAVIELLDAQHVKR